MKWSNACLLLCCFILVLQLFLPPVSSAKLYTWTDKTGIVRRTYYPPPVDQVRKNQVELYVTSWCPYCKKAIQYFQSKGIAYKAYDIEKDKQAAARKQELDSRSGVPFAVINGKRIHGYAPKSYAKALSK